MVSQLLFVSARAHRYIQTAVAFISDGVNKPDEDDWGEMKRVLKYLKVMRKLKLASSVGYMSVVKWWVYALYAVH